MGRSRNSPVFFFDNNDPAMQAAYEAARANFRYFWRELSWEYRRIIPALNFACVKTPFSDESTGDVEQMWLSQIEFDGDDISGVLINRPNKIKSHSEGDAVTLPLGRLTDWMYACGDAVFGGFTVQLIRSRMTPAERADHDRAWRLNFGDPTQVRVDDQDEHPMSLAMAESLRAALDDDPMLVHSADDRGWTLLHNQSLAGSVATVRILLDGGADPGAVTQDGKTPLQLAQALGWESVMTLLMEA